MQAIFESSNKIGDIVKRLPKASDLFKQNRIDFCCGGNRQLSEALQEKNIDEVVFLSQLNQLYEDMKNLNSNDRDWALVPYSDLIDHVVSTHHAFLQQELPELSGYVTKILRVHGPNHPELAQLHKFFHELKMDMEQHMIKEEEVIFPLIKKYETERSEDKLNTIVTANRELDEEHKASGSLLEQIRQVTNDFTLPEEACATYTLTFKRLEALESDMFQHIHLENNILFPRLENELAD